MACRAFKRPAVPVRDGRWIGQSTAQTADILGNGASGRWHSFTMPDQRCGSLLCATGEPSACSSWLTTANGAAHLSTPALRSAPPGLPGGTHTPARRRGPAGHRRRRWPLRRSSRRSRATFLVCQVGQHFGAGQAAFSSYWQVTHQAAVKSTLLAAVGHQGLSERRGPGSPAALRGGCAASAGPPPHLPCA